MLLRSTRSARDAPAIALVQLNVLLATAIDLQAQLRQARWNVREPGVVRLNAVFERAAIDVGHHADRIAERISGTGGRAAGTIRTVAKRSVLSPYPAETRDIAQNVAATSAALVVYAASLRDATDASRGRGDFVTAEMLGTSLANVERDLGWIAQAYQLACGDAPARPLSATDAAETSVRSRIEDWVNGEITTSAYLGQR
ncbi:hypothetical protein KL86APRO_10006 [uncultured Alphaproteobacteria bacterium]|uniref:Ferritin/DPS domain-containing protein n=1 Tax=uncultured Alphaproteobacteria bacterium TaxID=91750 RepID=A0A212ITK0_9PROT|nr:hypothetical protein KL86APRO_10006 [uncultured Alphaproteobacteria bacterium]